MDAGYRRIAIIAILAIALAVAACGGGAASASPAPSAAAFTLEAPAEVDAGSEVEVHWTGKPGRGDYLSILPAGATAAAGEPWVDVSTGNPVVLVAPAAPGSYEIVYLAGDTVDQIYARRPITVK